MPSTDWEDEQWCDRCGDRVTVRWSRLREVDADGELIVDVTGGACPGGHPFVGEPA